MTSRVNDTADDKRVVAAGQIFAAGIAILAMIVAPLLAQMQSIFDYLQKVNGLYSVPIIVIFLMGILTRRANARGEGGHGGGGSLVRCIHLCRRCDFRSAMAQLVPLAPRLRHQRGVGVCHGGCLLWSTSSSNEDPEACASPVDMNPWSMAKPIAVMIALAAVGLYVGLLLLSSG